MFEVILQSLANGLMLGLIYALITLGLGLVFGVMGIINFAHGDFLMVSMYSTFWLVVILGIDPIVSPLISAPILFVVGVIVYRVLIDRTIRSSQSSQIAITVGLMILLEAVAQIVWGNSPRALPSSIIVGSVSLGGIYLGLPRLASAVVSGVVLLGVYLLLSKTYFGLSLRAASDDVDATSLMGVNIKRINGLAFGLGLALISIPGAFLMTFQQVDPLVGISFGFLSWCVLALSGLNTIPGLVVSGIIVGVVESVGSTLWTPEARPLLIYSIFILVLWLRPKGLFGRK